jgi:hypothetical protein
MKEWRRLNPNHEAHYYYRMFQLLREAFGGKCIICERTWSLEFAHIKPTKLNGEGRGLRKRFYDIVNHPDSYCLMCNKDHKYFDSLCGEIKLQWLVKNSKIYIEV